MNSFRLKYLMFLWMMCCLNAQAQLTFRVRSLQKDVTDLTAREEPYMRTDNDGNLYAIIKVQSDVEGDDLEAFNFNFGNMNCLKQMHPEVGQLWLYVQMNAKKVTITRSGYTGIDQYDLRTTLEAGTTYRMKLSVQTPTVQHRVLQFKVAPVGEAAVVKVKKENTTGDYELWGEVDATGSIDRLMETGVYYYQIAVPNYETADGSIDLSNGSGTHVETVTLKPNFGWLEVKDEFGIAGAEIYVDDRKIGTVPYSNPKQRWEARDNYRIAIRNGELYKTYNATFAIRKGETTSLSPKLASNFAETTITVPNDAEIYINDVLKTRGTWTGPLKAGTYNIECRLPGHRSTKSQITIKPNEERSFQMPAPSPIVGSIYVTSNPAGAKIYLDKKEVGTTPQEVKDVLIGQHSIGIVRDGYKTEAKAVTVEEGKTEQVQFTLHDYADFTITTAPRGATLKIDGEYIGLTPQTIKKSSGEYNIELSKSKYKTESKRVMFNSAKPKMHFDLTRQYQRAYSGYLQVGLQAGGLTALTATLGGYLHNINLEGSYLLGLGAQEDIYWNSLSGGYSSAYTYKANALSFKMGYGIIMGTRFRLTPQVGMNYVMIDTDGDHHYVAPVTLGLKLDCTLVSAFGIYIAPEYAISMGGDDGYDRLKEVSTKIKGWGKGFNIRFGLTLSL